MTSLSKTVKQLRLKLARYNEGNALAIDIDNLTFGDIFFANEQLGKWHADYRQDRFKPKGELYNKHRLHAPLLNRQAINKLAENVDFEVRVVDGNRILFNRYVKVHVTRKRFGRRSWASHSEGITQKQNSRKKRARADSKAREIRRKNFQRWIAGKWYSNPAPDPYGINDVSNTSFGHPRRKFNVNDKGEANAQRRHKQRNTPTYPEA